MSWVKEWRDPNTEPYTVVHIERKGEIRWILNPKRGEDLPIMVAAPRGLYHFDVYYRNYTRPNTITIRGRDELEAFTRAQARIAKSKEATDRRLARKK